MDVLIVIKRCYEMVKLKIELHHRSLKVVEFMKEFHYKSLKRGEASMEELSHGLPHPQEGLMNLYRM